MYRIIVTIYFDSPQLFQDPNPIQVRTCTGNNSHDLFRFSRAVLRTETDVITVSIPGFGFSNGSGPPRKLRCITRDVLSNVSSIRKSNRCLLWSYYRYVYIIPVSRAQRGVLNLRTIGTATQNAISSFRFITFARYVRNVLTPLGRILGKLRNPAVRVTYVNLALKILSRRCRRLLAECRRLLAMRMSKLAS